MTSALQRLWTSLGPLGKTLFGCALADLLVVLLVYPFMSTWLASAIFSFVFIGPVSLYLGPGLYRHCRERSLQRPDAQGRDAGLR